MVFSSSSLGFTLVEIAIVMIIIGLLIGGVFGGRQLIDNMQVNAAVQEMKSFNSAALTFKDSFGRFPGDISNPFGRLPSCTSAPCSSGGNGDRRIGGNWDGQAISATDEEFLFWQHLFAAGLISNVKPVADLTYGQGQPNTPVGVGYRITGYWAGGAWWAMQQRGHLMWLTAESSSASSASWYGFDGVECKDIRSIDGKMDDGRPASGKMINVHCAVAFTDTTSDWNGANRKAALLYFLPF